MIPLKVQSNEIGFLDVKASSLRIPFDLIGRAGLGKLPHHRSFPEM